MHSALPAIKKTSYPARNTCPGFSADCLETIEEIGEENREYFMEAGGEKYDYIPALNADADHIAFLTELVKTNIQGCELPDNNAGEASQQHFMALKK